MQFKNNTKQRNKTIQGLRSFKDDFSTNVKKIIKKKGRIYSETLDNWKYIVGDDLFKVCYPKSFKSSNKLSASILNIMIKRDHEVYTEYSKNLIIQKMNKYFIYNIVEKVILINSEGDKIKYKKKIKQNHNKTKQDLNKSVKNIMEFQTRATKPN